ncbi:MAG: metallophosphoesterase [Geothrix sp.]|uniref:metallophosphoesterase family protein n=1 Tax=Geothrix sp. TaxID=1962974 RepID=UPI00181FC2AC|nr:metallophosphoesterase [Geothrix sp.]NWJ41569.1 metallophosphoesterase [Geothrix sp.]WIL20448.1 MAG: metallophosphoesterase [Geothrix sp.]
MPSNLRRVLGHFAVALIVSSVAVAAAHGNESEDRDPVVLKFSTVGDSRQDPVAFDPTTGPLSAQDKIWLQNSKAWSRIMRSIEDERSSLLFFNGDMIMGYGLAGPAPSNSVVDVVGSDLMAFYRQYAFWRGMVAPLMEAGTYVVPVAGNHEVQSKPLGKKAQIENENAWRANMGDLIIDTARFKAIVGTEATNVNVQNNGVYDGLATDQSQLSYSFDVGDVHFAVVNTDPVGKDNVAPAGWLATDFGAAAARGARHFFAFGHKPAYTYYFGTNTPANPGISGLDKLPASRDAFWNVIEQYHATYFCGHEHEFNLMQPRGAAWQVIVGSGGSPFDAKPGEVTLNPATDRTYAWATVAIHRSGKVTLTARGFNDTFGPTHILKQVKLSAE